jgi:hypothetical protein
VLLSWLYNPDNIYSVDDIIKIAKTFNVPDNIIISKYIQLLSFNGLTNDVIVSEILNKFNVTVNDEIIKRISEEHRHEENMSCDIYNLCNKKNTQLPPKKVISSIHGRYPKIDPEHGRPQLDWHICHHEKCMEKFKHSNELVRHLELHNCYVQGYHNRHEVLIQWNRLTKENILEKSLTVCPVHFCGERFNTPQELIIHFIMLGIPPFWEPGTVPVYEDLMKQLVPPKSIDYKPVYRNNICLCCCEKLPEIVYLPCNHSNLCNECYGKLRNKICPECRVPINDCLPY